MPEHSGGGGELNQKTQGERMRQPPDSARVGVQNQGANAFRSPFTTAPANTASPEPVLAARASAAARVRSAPESDSGTASQSEEKAAVRESPPAGRDIPGPGRPR